MNNILIIGSLPRNAGIGGVSIHVMRLIDYLRERNANIKFIDYKTVSIFKLIREIIANRIIHINASNPYAIFVMSLIGKISNSKVILTIHGNYGRFGAFKNWLEKISVKIVDVPILLNKQSYIKCRSLNHNSRLISAFIPPVKNEKLDKKTETLLNDLKTRGAIICSTNAYNLSYDKYRQDIYGVDFLIKEFRNAFFNNYILIISDPSGNYKKKYSTIPQNVYFFDYPHNYFELLKEIDIFIRYTTTDGDSLSVKEAMYLGKPVVCTDVVDRPDGVIKCKLYDEESFRRCLEEAADRTSKSTYGNIKNGAEEILEIYKNL